MAPWKVEEVMASRAGLRKVTKSVRGKKGTVRRSYWVKSQGAANKPMSAGGFVKKHAGRLAGAVAGGFVGGMAHRHLAMKGHRDSDLHGSLIGAGLGAVAMHAGKGGRALRADHKRMGMGGQMAVSAGFGVAGLAGHLAGFAAHKHLNHYTR